MASEVLSTFSLEMGAVTLVPGTGGIFEIHLDGELVWERKRDGSFPDVKQLKQLVRDRIDPDRDLGHIDRAASGNQNERMDSKTHGARMMPNDPSSATRRTRRHDC